MSDENRRSADEPEFLKDAQAAKDREATQSGQQHSTDRDNEEKTDRVVDEAILNTFRH